jgi:hypothetical protein
MSPMPPGTPAPPCPPCAPGGPGTGTPATAKVRTRLRCEAAGPQRCSLLTLVFYAGIRPRTSTARPPASSRRRRASQTAGRGRGRLDRRTALDSSGRAAAGRQGHGGTRAGGGRVLSARRLPRPLAGCRRHCPIGKHYVRVGVLFVQSCQHGLDAARPGDLILVCHASLPLPGVTGHLKPRILI